MLRRLPFVIVLVLLLVLGPSCGHSPKRYSVPPSTVPVRAAVAVTRSELSLALDDAAKLRENSAFRTPHSAILDSLTKHLLAAQAANEHAEAATLTLDTAIAKQTTDVNANADRAETAEAKAKQNASWRNRFLMVALGLGIFVLRKPLARLLGAGLRLARVSFGLPF